MKNRNIKFAEQTSPMKVRHSPIDGTSNVRILDKTAVRQVVEAYKIQYGIDIARFVCGESLIRYQCELTKLEFYRGISPGDGSFYESLMNFGWYYNPWKWEHEVVLQLVKPGDQLVEIGSGSGSFLEKLQLTKACTAIGLEINELAIKKAIERGVNVINKKLDTFSSENEERYDWSVSFQVLEHIEDVKGFLSHAVRVLRPQGKLVISVPNNDSFIGTSFNVLNMPPHHMNRWKRESLERIAPLFGLKLKRVEFEPLQIYHHAWYKREILEMLKKESLFKFPVIRGMVYHMLDRILTQWIEKESSNIAGHSILAIYEKDE